MTRQDATKITQNTLLPVSLIGTLIFLAFQIGISYNDVEAHTQKIEAIEMESKEVIKTLKSIENRLIKMETALELLAK